MSHRPVQLPDITPAAWDAPHDPACPCISCVSKVMRVGRKVRLVGSRTWPGAVVPVLAVDRDPATGWVHAVLVDVDGRSVRYRLDDVALVADRPTSATPQK